MYFLNQPIARAFDRDRAVISSTQKQQTQRASSDAIKPPHIILISQTEVQVTAILANHEFIRDQTFKIIKVHNPARLTLQTCIYWRLCLQERQHGNRMCAATFDLNLHDNKLRSQTPQTSKVFTLSNYNAGFLNVPQRRRSTRAGTQHFTMQ